LATICRSRSRAAAHARRRLPAARARSRSGGAVALKGTPEAERPRPSSTPARARPRQRSSRHGEADRGDGGLLEMNRGETANAREERNDPRGRGDPTYFDFGSRRRRDVTIHDPKGSTAVKFAFGGKCAAVGSSRWTRTVANRTGEGQCRQGRCEPLGRRRRLGVSSAVLSRRAVTPHPWPRAGLGASATPAARAAEAEATNEIDTDGRNYASRTKSVIPTIAVRIKGEGAPFTLHVATGGKEETFTGNGPSIKCPAPSSRRARTRTGSIATA